MAKKLFILFSFCCSAPWLRSQEVHQLNEVVVEGEAKNNAIEKQKKATSSKIVISSKDLNNFGHHTVGDVLKRMPRIFVQGPPSFNRNIMMGGVDKQYQAVLIDGERPAGGEDYRDIKLDRIPADMVEEIEIIYNPPAEWGADAAMGVVNIKLKDTPEKRTLLANMAADHTTTTTGVNPDASITYGDKKGKTAFLAGYSYNHFNRINTTSLTSPDTSGWQSEDVVVDIHAFTGNVKHTFNERSSLKFKTFFSNYHENLDYHANIKKTSDGSLNMRSDTASDVKLRRLHSQVLAYEYKGAHWKWTNTASFAQHFDQKDRWRVAEKSSGFEETFEDEDQKNTESYFRSDYIHQVHKHRIKAGFRASGLWRNYGRLVYTKGSGYKFWDSIEDGSYNLQEYRGGVYLTDELSWGKLFLVPSVRYDYDARSYQTADDADAFTYTSLNPSLHTKYAFSRGWNLKLDVARQISRPPFNAQVPIDKVKHKKATIERGNKELLPSTTANVGGGIEKYFRHNNYITVRGYHSAMRNVVEKKYVGIDEASGYEIIQYVNVDSAQVWGFDVDTRFLLLQYNSHYLELVANASLFGSHVRDASSGKMRRLNEQPEWITNGAIDYVNTQWKLQMSLGVNYVGKRYIAGGSDEGTLVNPQIYQPYLQWDGRIKYFFKPWGSVFVNAVNIFGEDIKRTQGDVSESEVVGTNVRLGISLSF